MLLSNWTLHFTHATPETSEPRSNLERCFSTPASLQEMLQLHAIGGRRVESPA